MYFIAAGLTAQQRNRRTNVLPFTLSLYGSNIDDVIKAIGPMLRTLDRGQRIRFLGKDKDSMLCASVLVYLGNMLQQNENSGTLGPTATFGCRSCLISKEKRSDLYFDIIS